MAAGAPPSTTSVVVRRIGNKIVLDDQLIEAICQAVRAGASIDVAAGRLGIGEKTIDRWLQRGRAALNIDPEAHLGDDEEAQYAKLAEAKPMAESVAEVSMVTLIVQAAQGGKLIEDRRIVHPNGEVETIRRYSQPDWRAAAFILERRVAARWGRHLKVDMAHSFTPETGRAEGERLNDSLAKWIASGGQVIEPDTE